MVLCSMPHQISRIFINVSLSQTRHEHTTATQSCSDFLLNGYQNVLLLKSNCDSQLLPIIHGWSITHKSIKKLYQLENCSRASKYDWIENKHKPYLGPKRENSFEFISSTVLNLIFIRVIKKTLGNIPLAHTGV